MKVSMADRTEKFTIITIQSQAEKVNEVCQQILNELHEKSYSSDDIFGVHLALEEALVNAVKHGNNNDPAKKVVIEYSVSDQKLEVNIIDEGTGFNPCNIPDPRCDGNVYKYGGRGLLLMREFMDFVEYNKAGNTVHMVRLKDSDKYSS